MTKKAKFQIDDKVAYSKTFLQSTGQMTGPIPFARGIITELKPMGPGSDTILARIDWGQSDIPERVNVGNLSRVTRAGVLDIG